MRTTDIAELIHSRAMRLQIIRPLPTTLEGLDVSHLHFGASHEVGSPLSDVLLASGYAIPEDSQPPEIPEPKHERDTPTT